MLFWVMDPKILLANQFADYFTFGLSDMLNLIPGVHCYIVLVSLDFHVVLGVERPKVIISFVRIKSIYI